MARVRFERACRFWGVAGKENVCLTCMSGSPGRGCFARWIMATRQLISLALSGSVWRLVPRSWCTENNRLNRRWWIHSHCDRGDHSLEYPDVAGVADVYGKENVGVIHFDAHYDAGGSGYTGHLISHAQPVYRLIEEGHVLGENYIQVGLRGCFWPGEEGFEWMRNNNFRYHTMVEIERDGWAVMGTRCMRSWSEFSRKRMMGRNISMCPLISMCWIQPSHRAREHRSRED